MSEPSAKQILEGAAPIAAQEIGEQVAEVLQNANSALNGVADAVGLTERVEKSPYGMVAAALGIGYVLGGGLLTPTTFRVLRMGMKLAAIPAVRDKLLDVAEAAVDGMLEKSSQDNEDEPGGSPS
ncbi:MAG: hypothetical protein JNJ54_26610 [Myxococcaceae bacterium]|nr:hypothetical protein [Myxococcaceae bacterium]